MVALTYSAGGAETVNTLLLLTSNIVLTSADLISEDIIGGSVFLFDDGTPSRSCRESSRRD